MARDDAYLLDLLIMAKDAHEFTKNHTSESFIADRQCQYAANRCLEVIGEVSKPLSQEIPQPVRIDRMVRVGTNAGHAHPFLWESGVGRMLGYRKP